MTPNPSVLISLRNACAPDRELAGRLTGWIRRLGYEPAVADSGRQIVTWVQERVFVASLLEWEVELETTGVPVWRTVRPILGRRLVLMTRERRKDLWFEALREGVGAVLPMPPREAMVRAALEAATGRSCPGPLGGLAQA